MSAMDGMDKAENNSTDVGMGGDMTMQMYFYASAQATILFKDWKTMTWPELLGSCLFFVLLAFLQEGLRALRYHLHVKNDTRSHRGRNKDGTIALDTTKDSVSYGGTTDSLVHDEPPSRFYTNKGHLLQSALHFLQIFISYCLMLVVMTYNIFLILSVCFGATFGYYLWAWRRPQYESDNDCCH